MSDTSDPVDPPGHRPPEQYSRAGDPSAATRDLARVQVELATAAADATPLDALELTTRDLTRVQPLLEQVLAVVMDLMGTPMAAVWVTEPAAAELYATCWAGLPDDYLSNLRVPYGQGSVGQAIQRREPVLYRDIRTEPLFEFRERAAALGIVSVYSMPMLTLTGRPMGALNAYFTAQADPSPQARA